MAVWVESRDYYGLLKFGCARAYCGHPRCFTHGDSSKWRKKPWRWTSRASASISTGDQTANGPSTKQRKEEKMKQAADIKRTKVVFVLDESGSINDYRLTDQVISSVNSYIKSLQDASTPTDVYERAIVKFNSSTKLWSGFGNVLNAALLDKYGYRPSGGTALIDGIDHALQLCSAEALADPDCAFLILVLTDGEENSSVKCTARRLKERIEVADASEKYTIVVNCPRNGVEFIAKNVGVPRGNIKPWEQTVKGAEELRGATVASLSTYTSARSAGVQATKSFYADTVGIDLTEVKKSLDDISAKVKQFTVTTPDKVVIRDFFQKKMGRYDAGRAYYELIKSEKVQQQKEIVILDQDTGRFYSGWTAARQLLGLPQTTGEIRLRPGRQGKLRVFIQSTSWTRKLHPGQRAIHVGD